MTSLRRRLFVILLAATGLIWLSAIAWIFVGTRSELEHVLDTRLQEAARMVSSLVADRGMAASTAIAAAPGLAPEPGSYERQLSCQIWSFDGHLVARSSGAPDENLSSSPSGLSERTVDGEPWRVYTIENAAAGVRVMVGDRLGLRDRLVADLIKGLLWPAVLIAPLLGLLIWASLGHGLRPLNAMAGDLRARDGNDMSPIDPGRAPSEVKPIAEALNGLFVKVETARRHERDVTAFAAHELRTPLAGLKTQAQIAIAAQDSDVRRGALNQILRSVDRTTRLVRQLLTLAKLDASMEVSEVESVNIGDILDEIAEPAGVTGDAVRIVIGTELRGLTLRSNRELLTLAFRNLHENAVQHMQNGGTVMWRSGPDANAISVEDEGPGIPAEDLALVTQRFFRGRHQSTVGTGLGLAITEVAIQKLGGSLLLENRQDGPGLRATIRLPKPDWTYPAGRSRIPL
ncbi:two-component system, OmpR family, sensor histidine kinase QseC [Kaistia soli DSM 19436]|uniref:histidine kinase n=1 Tax=Kaistia soli DSM 19436 TaxID=1122133 RepID=A0A1M5E0C6_9HYPH|nr:ATP-binding protein [Kaistia soli]SHF72718.1 two-component system, OmpR family, sensor histidine kinase QseC [Kaistia soli DSM 19436]